MEQSLERMAWVMFLGLMKILIKSIFLALKYEVATNSKGPHRPDAIRQRDANFYFSKTNKTVNG
jgi:hypothetical protein